MAMMSGTHSKKGTRMPPPRFWIVEYDLPRDRTPRRRFYKRVSSYLSRNPQALTTWSSYSVVVTSDKGFAEFVYRQALEVPAVRVRMWRACPVKAHGLAPWFGPPTAEQAEFMKRVYLER